MTFSRTGRKLLCQVLAGVLLFVQTAIAAYACAGFAKTVALNAMPTMSAVPSSHSPCEQMHNTSKALCVEHCHSAAQSTNASAPPVLQTAVPSLLYVLPAQSIWQAPRQTMAFTTNAVTAAAPPPRHAILHCVLRI